MKVGVSYGFTRLLEVSTVNSFILMNCNRRKENLKPLTHLMFGRNLIKQSAADRRNSNARKRGQPSCPDDVEHFNNGKKERECECVVIKC
jgi:hypothetical protein